jgi:hypothetical protein
VNAVYDARTRVYDLNLFSEADVDKTAEIYFGADPENRLSVCSTQVTNTQCSHNAVNR